MDFKLTKSDINVLLIYFAFAIPINWYDYADYEDKMDLVYESLLFVSADIICIYVILYVFFPKFFPKKQFVRLLTSSIIFLAVIGFAFINVYCLFYKCRNPTSLNAMYEGLTLVSESFTVPGLFLLGKKLYEAQVNFLQLEKEKKESELLRLSSQIDPHFLFNNLNTVDSLIDTNPTNAKIYLNKLAQLYRYLISTKDQEVVELEEELEFAQNYIYLIQSRFGNAYQFNLDIDTLNKTPIFIPPGALQILLENIVKHNQPRPNQPIISSLSLKKEVIEISNNLSIKTENVDSIGTGLANLKARYQLLVDKEIKITTNGYFTVALPLIKEVD